MSEGLTKEQAGDKGEVILKNLVNIWEVVEWKDEEEFGDPYITMKLYKSGKITIETYADDEVSEFNIDGTAKEDGV